jgi:hypothetical protein
MWRVVWKREEIDGGRRLYEARKRESFLNPCDGVGIQFATTDGWIGVSLLFFVTVSFCQSTQNVKIGIRNGNKRNHKSCMQSRAQPAHLTRIFLLLHISRSAPAGL